MTWDMQSWGLNWLDYQRRTFLATTISYTRGQVELFEATDATSCKITHKVMQGDVEVEVNGRDFIVPRSYFDGEMPIHGDLIFINVGDRQLSFRVANPNVGNDVYRDHDAQRLAIRIHTILESVK